MGGMALLGNPTPSGMQSAVQAIGQLQRLKQERESQLAEQAYRTRMAAVAEGNLGVNQTHANVYSSQAALQNQKLQMEMANEKVFNEQFLPQIQSWLAKQGGMGGQPPAPTGATQQVMPPAAAPTQPAMPQPAMPTPAAPAIKPSSVFQSADKFVSNIEGGFTPNDAGAGPTNYGVNQRANPDVDVKSLTPDSAAQIRKVRYWDAIGGDNLPQATAMVAYDAAINQGVPYARQLLQTTGGDPTLMLQQRKQDYQELAKQPRFAGQLKGWENRLVNLSSQIEGQPNTQPAPQQAPTSATGLAPDQQMRVIGAMQLMRDPATRAQGMRELAEAVTPKFAAPGSVDIRTGKALPNPALEETTRHNKAEEQFAGNRDIRETVKAGQELAKFPGELAQQGATLAETQQRTKKEVATTAETEAKTASEQQKNATQQATDYGQVRGVLNSAAELNRAATQLRDNPSLAHITGRYSLLPDAALTMFDPKALDARAQLNSIGSKVLLNTITALKALSENGSTGFGQLSNVEGEHLKNSIGSLNQAQTTGEMQTRLNDVLRNSNNMIDRAVGVYEKAHGKSPYEGLPVGTRPAILPNGSQRMSRNGNPLLKLPDGKFVEVQND